MERKERLFFCEEEKEFYSVVFMKKTIKIDWIRDKDLDQNVTYIDSLPFLLKKDGKNKHILSEYSEDELLIYPFQGGTPFYLRIAVKEDIFEQIKDCKLYGVDYSYYEKILKKYGIEDKL